MALSEEKRQILAMLEAKNALFQNIQAGARGKLIEIDQPEEHRYIMLFLE